MRLSHTHVTMPPASLPLWLLLPSSRVTVGCRASGRKPLKGQRSPRRLHGGLCPSISMLVSSLSWEQPPWPKSRVWRKRGKGQSQGEALGPSVRCPFGSLHRCPSWEGEGGVDFSKAPPYQSATSLFLGRAASLEPPTFRPGAWGWKALSFPFRVPCSFCSSLSIANFLLQS